MKIVYVRNRETRLYSIGDLAEALAVPMHTLWARIRRYHTFKGPDFQFHNRLYYSEAEFLRLKEEFAPAVEVQEAGQ